MGEAAAEAEADWLVITAPRDRQLSEGRSTDSSPPQSTDARSYFAPHAALAWWSASRLSPYRDAQLPAKCLKTALL